MSGTYFIYLEHWGADEEPCGKGVLDNIRGHCGDVYQWVCTKDNKEGVLLKFRLTGARYAKCALDGVWDASPANRRDTGLCCSYVGENVWVENTC